MKTQLWVVNVTMEMVVLAQNEETAKSVAARYGREGTEDAREIGSVRPVQSLQDLPRGWRDAFPWSDLGQFMTCGEMLR
jgi:hypothetical protein